MRLLKIDLDEIVDFVWLATCLSHLREQNVAVDVGVVLFVCLLFCLFNVFQIENANFDGIWAKTPGKDPPPPPKNFRVQLKERHMRE